MSPPPKNDWWLAAALSSAALPGALAQPATPDAVITTVPRSGAAQGSVRHTQVPADTVQGQRLTTDGQTAIHVLFADQSAITVGPNSDVLVQQYKFDEKAREGRMLVQITRGFLRMVGGVISKRQPAQVLTPTATIGVRGGISMVTVDGQTTEAGFLFGDELSVQQGDQTRSVFRPGFGISAGPNGLSDPSREVFERVLRLSQFGGPPPGGGPQGGTLAPGLIQGLDLEKMNEVFERDRQRMIDLLGTPHPGNQS